MATEWATVTTDPAPTGYSDVPAESTHAEGIRKATELGLMQGYPDGTFRPGEPVTRGQLATVLTNLNFVYWGSDEESA